MLTSDTWKKVVLLYNSGSQPVGGMPLCGGLKWFERKCVVERNIFVLKFQVIYHEYLISCLKGTDIILYDDDDYYYTLLYFDNSKCVIQYFYFHEY